MKKLVHQTVYLLVMLFYLVSLAPSAKVTTQNATDELREVIHALQVLQASALKSTQLFKKTLRFSIKTIQNVAGLKTVIFESHDPFEDKPSSILAITFRLAYLPASDYSLVASIARASFSFPQYCTFYLSPSFSPETPPPVIAV